MTFSLRAKTAEVAELVKFAHSVFALPFALVSAIVAARGLPDGMTLVWIVTAMVGARSAAMAFNRIVDRVIDARNPRTATRALVTGRLSLVTAWAIVLLGSALLVFSAYMLNRLALYLSPVALLVVLGYSYSKRFTSLSHLWLGLALGIAPVGAWIAVTGEIGFVSLLIFAAVVFWTAGFDIIYSLQDEKFDRKTGLYSLPARIGAGPALWVSRVFHAAMVAFLVVAGVVAGVGVLFFCGVAVVFVALVMEQYIVRNGDLEKVNAAFFTANGLVSVVFLVFVLLEFLL